MDLESFKFRVRATGLAVNILFYIEWIWLK